MITRTVADELSEGPIERSSELTKQAYKAELQETTIRKVTGEASTTYVLLQATARRLRPRYTSRRKSESSRVRRKRFANSLLEGVPVRDQDRPGNDRTLAEWIRQCRRAGLYEQGRVLYEKGGYSTWKTSTMRRRSRSRTIITCA